MSKTYEDLSERTFGRWKVMSEAEPAYYKGRRIRHWNCVCECGTERRVKEQSLLSGRSTSCGCHHSEIMREVGKQNITHGQANTRLYGIHRHMMNRCYNKNDIRFPEYGARGIRVCDEWHSFEAFYAWAIMSGYREDLSIDRIDVNGNYCPTNCRWATDSEQAINRRSTVLLEFGGKTQSISEWAKELGMPYKKLYKRIYSGWDIERALTT